MMFVNHPTWTTHDLPGSDRFRGVGDVVVLLERFVSPKKTSTWCLHRSSFSESQVRSLAMGMQRQHRYW